MLNPLFKSTLVRICGRRRKKKFSRFSPSLPFDRYTIHAGLTPPRLDGIYLQHGHQSHSATRVTQCNTSFHQDVWWSRSVTCIIFFNLSQCVRQRWLSSRRTIICLGERPLSKLRSFCTDVGRKF